MRHSAIALGGILILAVLFACSTITPAQQLTAACQSADAALRVAIAARTAGKLSPAVVARVNQAGGVVNSFCAGPVPPTTIPTALSALSGAVASLQVQ